MKRQTGFKAARLSLASNQIRKVMGKTEKSPVMLGMPGLNRIRNLTGASYLELGDLRSSGLGFSNSGSCLEWVLWMTTQYTYGKKEVV